MVSHLNLLRTGYNTDHLYCVLHHTSALTDHLYCVLHHTSALTLVSALYHGELASQILSLVH